MNLGPLQIALIVLAVLLSSIVQGTVGFAVALIAVPLLLQAGLDLPQSIFVVLVCSTIQNLIGLRHTWQDTPIRNLVPWATFRALLIPLGFLLMQSIQELSKTDLRRLFGIFLLVMILLQGALRIRPRESVATGWTILAMALSGITQGMIGTPGPPVAFWVMAHDWTSRKSRGVMFFLFVTGSVPHLVLMVLFLESQVIWTSAVISLSAIPLSLVGTTLGLWLGNQFDRRRTRLAIMMTLIILSLTLILTP